MRVELPVDPAAASQRVLVAHRDDATGAVELLEPVASAPGRVTVELAHFSTVEPVYEDPLLYADGSVAVSPARGTHAERTFTFENPGEAGEYVVGGTVRMSLWAGTAWVGTASMSVAVNGQRVLTGAGGYAGGSAQAAFTQPCALRRNDRRFLRCNG